MVHAMYVQAAYRDLGIGRKMLLELIRKVSSLKGLEQIHLWVLHSTTSTSASIFYQKCGFESQGTRVKQDLKIGNTYIDAEYMVLYL